MAKYRRGDVTVEARQIERPTVIATRKGVETGRVGDWLVEEDLPEGTPPHYGSAIPGILVQQKVKQFFVNPEVFADLYVKIEE